MSSRLLISSARSLMGHPFQSQAIRPMTSASRQGQLLFTNLLRKNPTVLAQRFMSSKKDEDSKDKKSKNDDSWIKFEFESNRSSNGGKLPTPGPQMSQNFATAFFGSLLLFMMYRILTSHDSSSQELSWEEFRASLLDKGLVEKLIVVNKKEVRVQTRTLGDVSNNVTPSYYFSIGSIDSFERRLDNAQESLGIPLSERIPVSFINEQSFMGYLMPILPTLVLFGSIIWVSKKLTAGGAGGAGGGMGGIFNIGKSRAKLFNQETDVNVKFNDVAGMEEAKEEIMEFVSFLKDPKRYERLGAKIPRGAILSGPPGTGKTLIAKATAGEAGVPFLSVSGSEFVEMFVGVGASRVRDLFKTARDMAPSIIFIDEIDAIGKKRNEGGFTGGNDERESTLNQLLVEMDGFNTSEHIVVLAGTNLPEVLDPALLRPGRFDRHISIDNPSVEGRKEIFMVHLQKITTNLNRTELAGRLAALSPGFSGANIANTCNEAALIAAREDADTVLTRHFEHAIERIIGGLERKSRVLNPEEKRTVAYHEAGHAICGWYFKYADPLLKVSIVPRGSGTLGYAQYLPPDIHLLSYTQLIDRMAMTLGGRTSEEMHFSSVTSGGSDDFKKVTQIATAMVTKYGMSPKLGTVSLSLGEDGYKKPFSEETAKIIDEEVKRIVDEAYLQCSNLLKEKKAEVALVAEELLKKEVITREDMIRLLGKRAFVERNDAFDKYLNDKNGPKTEEPPLAKGEI